MNEALPSTMTAAVYQNRGEPLTLEQRPVPKPGPHQLLVRVRAVGICGSDIHASDADWTPTGIIMGHEFAGEVVALGPDVKGWTIGDRVLPMPTLSCGTCPACLAEDFPRCTAQQTLDYNPAYGGAYAEYTVVGAHDSLPLPKAVDFDAAAAVEPLAVGYDAVRRAQLRPDDRALIIGAGPIGLTIAQWCRHFGLADVVVSEPNAARRALAESLGATATIDPHEVDDVAGAFTESAGAPASLIFEAVGAPGMIQHCVAMAADASRIVVVGVCMATDSFEPMMAIQKRLQLQFTLGYSLDDYRLILRLLGQGRIQALPLVSHRIDLSQLPERFEALRKPGDEIKVIVNP